MEKTRDTNKRIRTGFSRNGRRRNRTSTRLAEVYVGYNIKNLNDTGKKVFLESTLYKM